MAAEQELIHLVEDIVKERDPALFERVGYSADVLESGTITEQDMAEIVYSQIRYIQGGLEDFFAKRPLTVEDGHITPDLSGSRDLIINALQDQPAPLVYGAVLSVLDSLERDFSKQEVKALRSELDPGGKDVFDLEDLERIYSVLENGVDEYVENSLYDELPSIPEIDNPVTQAGEKPVIIMCTPYERNIYGRVQNSLESFDVSLRNRFNWETLKGTIEAAGATVKVIDGASAEGSRREVYTRDPVFPVPWQKTVYVPTQASADLLAEQEQILETYREYGWNIVEVEASFEGGNLIADEHAIDPLTGKKGVILMGYHHMVGEEEVSDYSAAVQAEDRNNMEKLSEASGVPVIPIECSINHLDRVLAVLPNRKLAYAPVKGMYSGSGDIVFSEDAIGLLQSIYGEDSFLETTFREMGTNGITVGNTFISNHASQAVRESLEGDGYQVVTASDISDLISFPSGSADGSVRCQTNHMGTNPQVTPGQKH